MDLRSDNLEDLEHRDTLKYLQQAIGELPELQREVLLLSLNSDLDYKEIGLVVRRSRGAVKTLIRRARARLALALQEREEKVIRESVA